MATVQFLAATLGIALILGAVLVAGYAYGYSEGRGSRVERYRKRSSRKGASDEKIL